MITTNAIRRRAAARVCRQTHAQRPIDAHHHLLIALQAQKEGDATPDALIGFACPCGDLFTPNGNPSFLYVEQAHAIGQDKKKRNRSHLRRVYAYEHLRKAIAEALAQVEAQRELAAKAAA